MIRFLLLICACLPLYAAPKVVVSIKPLHDLTLAVMEGISTPTLLVPSGASPHTYALAPSQAKALYEAELIIWVGPSLETFLARPLERRRPDSRLLTLLDFPGMQLYPIQTSQEQDHHHHGPIDPHLWLDPLNMMTYVQELTRVLSQLDPANQRQYTANAALLTSEIKQLNQSLKEKLAPVSNTPIMVFHDAYQYFEKRYDLNVVGTITLQPEIAPSVSRVLEIQQTLKSGKVQCIFSEPQFKPALVERLTSSMQIKHGVLDPLGSSSETGLAGYQALLNNLADSFLSCATNR